MLDAEYRPPAAHGDVLRAALRRPRAIGLVDGVFERVPAVWHKEILFALSEGVHVYGAASMGALRAAELDAFGMRGVGDVYRAYADGVLEDDDEVAVAHADAEHGFRALSDAMVDVRATLAAAVAAGVVDGATADRSWRRVKATFYAERALVAALDRGDEEHERLRAWLPDGRVERKREDAFELLRAIRARPRRGPRAVQAGVDAAADALLGGGAALGRARGGDDPGTDGRRGARGGARRGAPRPGRVRPARSIARCSPRWRGTLPRRPASTSRPGRTRRRSRRSGGHAACSSPKTSTRGSTSATSTAADLPEVARRLAVLRWARDAHRDAVAGEVALARPLRRRLRAARRPRGAQARRARIAPVRSSDPRRRRSSSSGTSASGSDGRYPSRSTPGRRRTAGAASTTSCGRSGRVVVPASSRRR